MWVVQVQKDLVDLSKHYIHEIDALDSLDKKKKQNKTKQNKNENAMLTKPVFIIFYQLTSMLGKECTNIKRSTNDKKC